MTTENSFDTITSISIENLRLDPKNPRLPSSVDKNNPDSIIEYLANETAIENLMSSIANNGFFPGEPIVAVPIEGDSENYHVVEGNRRLTAVMLLNNPNLLQQANLLIHKISEDAEKKPRKLPVVIHENRDEVLPYLGFRHISGVKEWEPLAKARYIKQLFDRTSSELAITEKYFKVGQQVGSNKGYVKRALDALAAYQVIEGSNFYDIAGLEEKNIKFAVLSTAIADENISRYIGFSREENNEPTNPIMGSNSIKSNELKNLVHWLYEKVPGQKDKKSKPRVPESRNIRELSCVVSNPKALVAFEDGASLKTAYEMTAGVRNEFAELIYKADSLMSEAVSTLTSIEYDEELISVVRRIYNNSLLVGKTLKEKKSDDEF